MQVIVEGVITSVQEVEKNDKKSTRIFLAQTGEKQQVMVSLPDHVASNYDLYEVATFAGRLSAWAQRDGIGMMVNATA